MGAASGVVRRRWEIAMDDEAPGAARRALASQIARTAAGRLDDILLAATELVSNAVRHSGARGRGVLILEVHADGGSVRVDVEDPGPGFDASRIEEPEPLADSGFGLRIVSRLAARWGIAPGPPTRVWFLIEL